MKKQHLPLLLLLSSMGNQNIFAMNDGPRKDSSQSLSSFSVISSEANFKKAPYDMHSGPKIFIKTFDPDIGKNFLGTNIRPLRLFSLPKNGVKDKEQLSSLFPSPSLKSSSQATEPLNYHIGSGISEDVPLSHVHEETQTDILTTAEGQSQTKGIHTQETSVQTLGEMPKNNHKIKGSKEEVSEQKNFQREPLESSNSVAWKDSGSAESSENSLKSTEEARKVENSLKESKTPAFFVEGENIPLNTATQTQENTAKTQDTATQTQDTATQTQENKVKDREIPRKALSTPAASTQGLEKITLHQPISVYYGGRTSYGPTIPKPSSGASQTILGPSSVLPSPLKTPCSQEEAPSKVSVATQTSENEKIQKNKPQSLGTEGKKNMQRKAFQELFIQYFSPLQRKLMDLRQFFTKKLTQLKKIEENTMDLKKIQANLPKKLLHTRIARSIQQKILIFKKRMAEKMEAWVIPLKSMWSHGRKFIQSKMEQLSSMEKPLSLHAQPLRYRNVVAARVYPESAGDKINRWFYASHSKSFGQNIPLLGGARRISMIPSYIQYGDNTNIRLKRSLPRWKTEEENTLRV